MTASRLMVRLTPTWNPVTNDGQGTICHFHGRLMPGSCCNGEPPLRFKALHRQLPANSRAGKHIHSRTSPSVALTNIA
ncbi:hypothetical protein E2C01_071869 [Portunus trituberculatus]|uniref:Uncharacterized protein n=1 Tax=Portunus trituberculatus TaxID=210409 RepID=A0A5B7I677_PORTR|nr:hypothetical protein [Portunus trituberculatus]